MMFGVIRFVAAASEERHDAVAGSDVPTFVGGFDGKLQQGTELTVRLGLEFAGFLPLQIMNTDSICGAVTLPKSAIFDPVHDGSQRWF